MSLYKHRRGACKTSFDGENRCRALAPRGQTFLRTVGGAPRPQRCRFQEAEQSWSPWGFSAKPGHAASMACQGAGDDPALQIPGLNAKIADEHCGERLCAPIDALEGAAVERLLVGAQREALTAPRANRSARSLPGRSRDGEMRRVVSLPWNRKPKLTATCGEFLKSTRSDTRSGTGKAPRRRPSFQEKR